MSRDPDATAASNRSTEGNETPREEEQARLIEEHYSWACGVASSAWRGWQGAGVTEGECWSEAAMALIEAAARYEGRNGASFKTFARTRVWGAVHDLLDNGKAIQNATADVSVAEELDSEYNYSSTAAPAPHVPGTRASGPKSRARDMLDGRNTAILAAWLPLMHFPADKEAELRRKVLTTCAKLSEAGCDVAAILAAAYRYAAMHDFRQFQLNQSKRGPTDLERLTDEMCSEASSTAELIGALTSRLDSLENLAKRNPDAYAVVLSSMRRPPEVDAWLSRFRALLTEVATAPRTRPQALVRWRSAALGEMVRALEGRQVTQRWKKLSVLVSSFRPESVDVWLAGNPPSIEMQYSEEALERQAKDLQNEWFHACAGAGDDPPSLARDQ